MIKHFDDITGEPTFLTSDFDEPVLYAPARTDSVHPCTSLKVITAFTDCERISTHMIKLAEGIKSNRFVKGLSIEILLGMTKSSLSQKKHEDICRMIGFLNSSKGMPKISCRYICNGPEVHSKVYVWTTPDDTVGELPQVAFCGSLNYTMNAFYKRRESVSMCSSIMAYRYYKELLPDTIDCFDSAVSEKLKNVINNTADTVVDPDNYEKEKGEENIYKQKSDVEFDDYEDAKITIEEDSCTIEMKAISDGLTFGVKIVISKIGEIELKLPEVD